METADVPETGTNSVAAVPGTQMQLDTKDSQQPQTSDGDALDVDLKRGTKLEAKWGNRWLPVTVKREFPNGMVEIHWDGYSDNFDEALPKQSLRRIEK